MNGSGGASAEAAVLSDSAAFPELGGRGSRGGGGRGVGGGGGRPGAVAVAADVDMDNSISNGGRGGRGSGGRGRGRSGYAGAAAATSSPPSVVAVPIGKVAAESTTSRRDPAASPSPPPSPTPASASGNGEKDVEGSELVPEQKLSPPPPAYAPLPMGMAPMMAPPPHHPMGAAGMPAGVSGMPPPYAAFHHPGFHHPGAPYPPPEMAFAPGQMHWCVSCRPTPSSLPLQPPPLPPFSAAANRHDTLVVSRLMIPTDWTACLRCVGEGRCRSAVAEIFPRASAGGTTDQPIHTGRVDAGADRATAKLKERRFPSPSI
jgi:hypothetical protein